MGQPWYKPPLQWPGGRTSASAQFPPPKLPPGNWWSLQIACCCCTLHPPFRAEGRWHGFVKEYILFTYYTKDINSSYMKQLARAYHTPAESPHLGREQRRVDGTLWTPPSSNTFFQQLFQSLLHFQSQIIQPCLIVNRENSKYESWEKYSLCLATLLQLRREVNS